MIHDICRHKRLGVCLIQRVIFMQSRNVLNLCEDSKRTAVVTIRTTAQNKFINCLRLATAESNFPTTRYRYADKWLRKRVFSCSSGTGNPRHRIARDCAAIFPGVQSCNRQAALSFSVKAPASAIVTILAQQFPLREKCNAKKQKPGIAGLLQSLDLGRLTSPAWRSDVQGARPFGSLRSCERCCAAQHASVPARRWPLP